MCLCVQIGTTKGTGGDVLILEEAAYCDPNFFYETLAPILLIDRTSLLAISTLTSEINFYSRLMKLRDSATGRAIFTIMQIQLARRFRWGGRWLGIFLGCFHWRLELHVAVGVLF